MKPGYISETIEIQNKAACYGLPRKYKHIMDMIISDAHGRFSTLELVRKHMKDTTNLKKEMDKLLQDRSKYLQDMHNLIV